MIVTFESTANEAGLGADYAFWRSVANGETMTNWTDRIPSAARAATIGAVESMQADGVKFQDITQTVSLDGDDVVFKVVARQA